MSSSALNRDAFMPRPPGGMGQGLALALGVHVLLVVALAFSVSWHTSSPAVAEAELWGAVPQVAAPRAADPEPPPKPVPQPVKAAPPPPPVVRAEPEPAKVPDAQIAIEKAKKDEAKKEEAKREEARREKLAEEAREAKEKEKEKEDLARKKKEKQAEAERKAEEALIEARERNIKKILGDAAATGTAEAKGTATESRSLSPSYAGRLKARVKPNIVFADAIEGNPVAEVEVRCAPDGKILSKRLLKASGVKSWDDAVLRAIDKTEVFPKDEDGRMPSPLTLVFSLRDL